jgi:serine palmitoyltransferase
VILWTNSSKKIPSLEVQGYSFSPVKHLRFTGFGTNHEQEKKRLLQVCDYAWNKGIAITMARYLDNEEHLCPNPSIRLIVSASLTKEEMESVATVLEEAFDKWSSS